MDKSCRYCKHYDLENGHCNHEAMFDVIDSGTGMYLEDLSLDENVHSSDTIGVAIFKIKEPREFYCCYYE